MISSALFRSNLLVLFIPVLLAASVSWSIALDNPVLNAVLSRDMRGLKVLLESGAPVDLRDNGGNTPLASAAILGDEEAAKILLEKGAGVNVRNRAGDSPLMLATAAGSLEMVSMLLESGAEVDAPNMMSITPLIAASQGGKEQIVRILIAAGADVRAQDTTGKNPATYAKESGHTRVSRLLLDHENSLSFRIRSFFLTYPFIDPVAFRIGRLSVGWYGLMYLLGVILGTGVILSELLRRRGPVPLEATLFMLAYGLVGILIGGRLGVVAYHPGYFLTHPLQIFALWREGMSFFGAFVGIVVAGWVLARHRNLPLREMADVGVLAVPLGIMMVRIGNFINGELVGKVTTLPWGVVFPGTGRLPRHPSQLYEAFFEGMVLFGILWVFRLRARRPGQVFGLFLFFYGVFRFVLELFREPEVISLRLASCLTATQILCLITIVVGAWIVFLPFREKT